MFNSYRSTTILAGVMTTAIVAGILLLQSARVPDVGASTPPDTLTLMGTVRDFQRAHPDFDVVPAGGYGHYAGNVEPVLGSDGRPVFAAGTGGGGVVNAFPGLGGLAVENKLTGKGVTTLIDGFDSSQGPYGGANSELPVILSSNSNNSGIVSLADVTVIGSIYTGPGPNPSTALGLNQVILSGQTGMLDETIEIPTVTVPTDMGSSVGDVVYNGVTATVSSDVHCDNFYIDGGGLVWIDGNVTIYAEGEFKLSNVSELRLRAGAQLTVYTEKDFKLEGASRFNANTDDPKLVEVNLPGSDIVKIDDGSECWALFTAPLGELQIASESELYGTFIGGSAKIEDSDVHIDLSAVGSSVGGGAANGYKVLTQWRDDTGRAIAPHLAQSGGGGGSGGAFGVRMTEYLDLSKITIDSFDSTLGPYGPGNSGGDADVSTNSTAAGAISIDGDVTIYGNVFAGPGSDPNTVIDNSGTITGTTGTLAEPFPTPVITVPSDAEVGPNLGQVEFNGGEAVTIDSNRHYESLRICTEAIVTISGNVVILVEDRFTTETLGQLMVSPGSSLDIYVKGQTVIKTKSSWSDPSNTRLYIIGNPVFKMETEAAFYGTVLAPDALLQLKTKAHIYGSIFARAIKAETESGLHVNRGAVGGDGSNPEPACGTFNDTSGSSGVASTGGITTADTFDTWFRDVLETNLSMAHAITLQRNGDVYEYLDDEFHPIDGVLFADADVGHNRFLTYAIRSEFVYEECAGQFIEFDGNDDAWVYVDGQLAMDRGGVLPGTSQFVDMDRLGLTDGESYQLHFFYAQRQAMQPVFRLRTNLILDSDTTVTASAGFD